MHFSTVNAPPFTPGLLPWPLQQFMERGSLKFLLSPEVTMPAYPSQTPVSHVFKQNVSAYVLGTHRNTLMVGILGARAGWWLAPAGTGEAPQFPLDFT